MRWLFVALVVAHGLIHFMGFAKAFGLAALPQLTTPISRLAGLAWLTAGVLLLSTAFFFVWAPRLWWAVAVVAVGLSQGVIVSAWGDARFGTFANGVILAVALFGFA